MSSRKLKVALITWTVFCAATLARMAEAGEWKVLELDAVNVNYKQFTPGGRDPLISSNGLEGRYLDKELNLTVNSNLFKYGYWNNMVHSMTDQDLDGRGQFRLVGWNMKLGVHLGPYLDVQYEHFSKHILDAPYAPGFPVQDSVGIVIHLYRRDR